MPSGAALTPENVLTRMRGRFAVPYLWEPAVPSTQDLLRGSGLPEGAVAVAEHQTAGRGRQGRRWEDVPARSVLVSVLLRPPSGARLPQLSLVAGLATAEAIEAVSGIEAGIKWPNDVLLDGAKAAGILLEGDDDAVVCGIGVNVTQTAEELPGGTTLGATSLALASGRPVDRATVLATVLDVLEQRYDTWRHEGIGALLPALERRNALRGRRARAGAVEGVVGRLTEDGLISLVTTDGSEQAIVSGELTLVQPGGDG